jgi:tRNA (5-methylaminomethyl-2-thiouridylate)-methyltransferase
MKDLSDNRIVIGLSGGVDSTTAALLLKEAGMEVTGYYFDVLGNNVKGVENAARAAEEIGIDFIHEDVSQEFRDIVIRNFCDEYMNGRTPNPCVLCNPNIKFKKMIETADRIGAKYISTGHYGRIAKDEINDLYFVRMGASYKKDQSYMLYRLGQDILSRIRFPIGGIEDKDNTRSIARKHHMFNADASDSQEICFVSSESGGYVKYIENLGFHAEKGNFVDRNGKVLGKHSGLINYTIGQRKGLGITFGRPAFVTAIDPQSNTVTLGRNDELFEREIFSKDNFFAATSGSEIPEIYGKNPRVMAKIRYAAKPSPATVSQTEDGRLLTLFDEPQRAATPGQSVVFYIDDMVIGGGFIDYK